MKILLVTIVILIFSSFAAAQQTARTVAPATAKPAEQIEPAMKLEDQLRIRNLQYSKDKNLLKLQQLQAQMKELQQYDKDIDESINDVVRQSRVDFSLFIFDLDTLRFVPRPRPNTPEVKRQ